jgi:4-hydroxybutyryl-CoA synthetase (ADP-forming)
MPIPIFPNPEEVFDLLAKYRDYYLRKKEEKSFSFKVNRKKVEEIVKREPPGKISDISAFEILKNYGIKTVEPLLIRDEKELEKILDKVEYPQVMKISSPDIIHKSDIGGVKIGIKNKEEFRNSYYEILENVKRNFPGAKIEGILSYKMVERGKEVIVGVKRDESFGHTLMFGLGGVYVEILKDVSFRIVPFSLEDVKSMIDEVKSSALLYGVRGEAPSDVYSLIEVIFKLALLVKDFPQIKELDINPLIVLEKGKGAVVVDTRIIIS